MEKYKLSICIPTYNRKEFLRLCLDRTINQIQQLSRNDIEISVVDNSSTDGSVDLLREYANLHPYLKFRTRPETIDITSQWTDALLAGKGMWTVYLADDDRLDLKIILDHIESVGCGSDVSAIYSDWYAWDDAAEKEMHRYFEIGGEQRFEYGKDNLKLLNFVLQKRVLPEIAIYQSKILQEAFVAASQNEFFYQTLLSLFKRGTVFFKDPPFYFENRIIKPHLRRQHWANIDLQTSQIDGIRSSLENLAANLTLGVSISAENRLKLQDLIALFVCRRLCVLRNRALHGKKWVDALRMEDRIRLWYPQMAMPNNSMKDRMGYCDVVKFATIDCACKRAALLKAKVIYLTPRLMGLLALFESMKAPGLEVKENRMGMECIANESDHFYVLYDLVELGAYLEKRGGRAYALDFSALAKSLSNTVSLNFS
jgi:glycosyltransferase involved in cell wall biosynthesis